MTMSRREKILIFALIVIFITYLFARLIYIPNIKEIQALETDKQNLVLQKQKLETIREQQAKSPDKQEKELEELEVLRTRVPLHDDLLPLMRFINNAAGQSNLLMLSLTYSAGETKPESGVAKITFNVGTSGSFCALINFLQILYDSPRLINIEDISLDAVKKEAVQISEADKSAPSYYIPPPAVPEAKGSRKKVEVIEKEYLSQSAPEARASDSLLRGTFKMNLKLTMYYFAGDGDTPAADSQKKPVNNDKGV